MAHGEITLASSPQTTAVDAGVGALHAGQIDADIPARTAHKQLAAVLVVGAAIRILLVCCFGSDRPVSFDAIDYNRLAVGLVETGAYADDAGRLISLRPPLFAAVVAGIYWLFGTENFFAVSSFHAALSLATVLLVYRLGVEVYSRRVGVLAAATTCFYPSLLAYNQLFLSEVIFAFFVTAGALLSVRALKTAGLGDAAALGLCLGLGALTRSVLWLFAPLLCMGLAVATNAKFGRRLAVASLALVVFALTITPWAWRNTQVQKTLTFIDVMGGRNVMMGNYEFTPLDRSWATIDTQTGDQAWHRVLAEHTDLAQLTQGQLDKAAMRYGVRYFFEHPWQSLQRSTIKFFDFWQLEREIVASLRQGSFGSLPVFVAIGAALVVCGAYAATVLGAIYGAWVVPPVERAAHAVLMAWIAFPWALHTVAFAHSRYHLPLIPIVAVYAAAAFVHRSAIFQRRKNWVFAAACAASGLLLASWVREFIMVDMQWFT